MNDKQSIITIMDLMIHLMIQNKRMKQENKERKTG